MTETFGVDSKIHPEWYFEGEDKWIQSTLLLGVRLSEVGYKIEYIHGPVGLYQNVILTTVSMTIPPDDNFYEYFLMNNPKDYIYFLYQLREEERRLRYARISDIDWEAITEKTKAKRKEKVE